MQLLVTLSALLAVAAPVIVEGLLVVCCNQNRAIFSTVTF